MVINALVIGISRLHVKWTNTRYEQSRSMLFIAMIGMAAQYLMQMLFGFRNHADDLGAVVNILIYTPCFTLISYAIYNIETTQTKRGKFGTVCACFYAAIIIVFGIGAFLNGNMHIGAWLYVMLFLFGANVVFCIYMNFREMLKRKKILETMTATDLMPFVRYSHAGLTFLFLAAFVMPFAILSTTLLYIVGPIALLAVLFFNMNFIAIAYNYTPSEDTLTPKNANDYIYPAFGQTHTNTSVVENEEDSETSDTALSPERESSIKLALEDWCKTEGYKDSSVNLMTLSSALKISQKDLKQYLGKSVNTTFRLWLSDIRFDAAKKMMIDFPNYSNDVISAKCGFSSRSHLYRIFKAKESCTPTEWRESQKSVHSE